MRIFLSILAALAFLCAAVAAGLTQIPIIGGYLMPVGKIGAIGLTIVGLVFTGFAVLWKRRNK